MGQWLKSQLNTKIPASWIVTLLAAMALWLPHSRTIQAGPVAAAVQAEYPSLSLSELGRAEEQHLGFGVLWYFDIERVRDHQGQPWRVSWSLNGWALLGTLILTLPVYFLGRRSWRLMQTLNPPAQAH